jgi:large subunit ribosomal protein L25
MTMTLAVTPRDESINLETLRANGSLPAVVYGPAQKPLAITIDEKVFDKVRKEAGESTVLELTGVEGSIEVLIKEVDFDPVRQRVQHVDLYALEKGKEITTNVPLHFIGVAPVEESNLGSVTKILHEIEVTCKPANLPGHIDVDLTVLEAVSDKIHVSDLVVPAGVQIESDLEESVAVVSAAKQTPAEEDEATETTIDMTQIEVEKKGKAETPEEN